MGDGYLSPDAWYVFRLSVIDMELTTCIGGLSTSTDSNAGSVVGAPVAAKIVSTGWPISRTGSGHFDPSRDPRLLYL